MSLLDDPGVSVPLLMPRGYINIPGTDEEANPAKSPEIKSAPSPTWSDYVQDLGSLTNPTLPPTPTFQAAFRQDNTLGSAVARMQDTFGVSNDLTDQNYSPWTDVVGTPYEKYWKSTFAYSNNHAYTEALKRSIDRQEADERTVRSGGALGVMDGIIAGAVDPTMLLPVGGEVRLASKGIWSVAKGALGGARAGALGTAAYELALHGSQDTRTAEQSIANISTGVVLGAVLGGTVAGVLSKTQRVASEDALEKLVNVPVPGSVGAAAPHYFSLDDLTINGEITKNIAAGTAFSPNLRGNFRESPLARRTYMELATNTLRQNMHDEGLSLGPSVETNMNVSLGETLGQALEHHNPIYIEGKKAGFGLSKDAFDDATGVAMRRGDIGQNDYVTNAAKLWRKTVIEPLTDQAIKLGMLPEDVSVSEAPSYFSRQYNVDKLTAEKPQFMAVTTDHFNGVLQAQYQKSVSALQTRQQAIDEELGNLKLSPEERIAKLQDLEGQRSTLNEQFPNESAIADQIRNLRAEVRKAKDTGDEAGAQVAQTKLDNLKASGGENFQAFKTAEAKLKKTQRQIGLGYAGMQDKAGAVSNQLTDLSHTNFRQLSRLVSRGQKLGMELQKLDPAKLRQRVSDLRSEFYGLITRSEQSQDRLAKQIEALRADEDKKVQSALAEAGLNKEKLNKTETKKAAKIEKEVRATNTAITDRLQKGLAAEQARTSRLSAISDRLQAAESIDNTTDLNDIKNAVDSLTLEISNKALGRGERAVELQTRLAKLDPSKVDEHIANLQQLRKDLERKFLDQWEIKRLGEGVNPADIEHMPDFSAHAKDMAQEVYDSITGNDYGSASVDPKFNLAAKSGPLKDRTFHIPDEKIEPWLENNVVRVMSRFARKMAAQIEIARKFPDDPLLKNRFNSIKNEYDTLVDGAKTPQERTALQKDMKGAFRDLRALLEIHRGSYLQKENASSWGRIIRGTMLFNYIRSMGGSAIPSLSDIYGPALFHGFGNVMEAGVPNIVNIIKKQGLLIKEAHMAGVAERLTHHRLLSLAEIGDPYGNGTSIERLLENGSHLASKWNGLNMLTDFEKTFDSIVVQHRLNEALLAGGKASAKDISWAAQSGLDPHMRSRISELLQQYGTKEDGITVANTDQWNDFDAVRAYRSAINFNVNADIVTRGIGDVPLAAYHPLGKVFLQFKTFNLAAHQRMFLRSMQLGPAQFLSGLMGLATLGMFTAYLKAMRGGKENYERFLNSAKNPGYLFGEGIDNTGMMTLPIEIGNDVEAATAQAGYRLNPVKTPLMLAGRAFVPDASLQGASQRYATKSFIEALAGPTGGLVGDTIVGPGGIIIDKSTGKEVSQAHKNALQRVVPYQSYLGMRELLQVLEGNSPYTQ